MANPITDLPGFSSPGATALPWQEGRDLLAAAETYLLTTVRSDGRPHSTPLLGVWVDDVGYFCTGAGEQKARNLEHSAACSLAVANGRLDGLDVVAEGTAARVDGDDELGRVADAYEEKYGAHVGPGGTWDGICDAIRGRQTVTFRVTPSKVLGFGKGRVYTQTRWRFG